MVANYFPEFKQRLYLLTAFLAVFFGIYLTIDYRGPTEISLYPDSAFGLPVLRAKDLVVQEYDQNGNLWATRGMLVYKLEEGKSKFKRVARVPTGFSVYWVRNFSVIRRWTIRPECVEMTVNSKGDIIALSAGHIWLLPSKGKKFQEVFILDHYGPGNQGLRNAGIVSVNDTLVYLGEYFRNPDKEKVRIYNSLNNFRSFEVAFEFEPGETRHIHAVQKDPYSEKLWVCTGDADNESMVAWSDNGFSSINKIGHGSQIWRVCQLVFTEEALYWGTDTGNEDVAGIYRWVRDTGELKKLKEIDREVFYGVRLANGTIVMSTTLTRADTEKDNKTSIFVMTGDNDKIISIEGGTWKHNKPGFWFKYAKLRFQRDQGGPSLAMTILNQKEFPDGELIIISEDTLIEAAENLN